MLADLDGGDLGRGLEVQEEVDHPGTGAPRGLLPLRLVAGVLVRVVHAAVVQPARHLLPRARAPEPGPQPLVAPRGLEAQPAVRGRGVTVERGLVVPRRHVDHAREGLRPVVRVDQPGRPAAQREAAVRQAQAALHPSHPARLLLRVEVAGHDDPYVGRVLALDQHGQQIAGRHAPHPLALARHEAAAAQGGRGEHEAVGLVGDVDVAADGRCHLGQRPAHQGRHEPLGRGGLGPRHHVEAHGDRGLLGDRADHRGRAATQGHLPHRDGEVLHRRR